LATSDAVSAFVGKGQTSGGATVRLWRPADDSAMFAGRPGNVPARAPPRRILIVDGDAMVAAGTAAMLETLGHVVIEASSGRGRWTVCVVAPRSIWRSRIMRCRT